MRSTLPLCAVAVCAVLVCASCGTTPTPAEKIRPDAMSAAQVTGDSGGCADPSAEAEPLIIDLPARRRGDLEVLMREGLVPVSYDCKSMKIVRGCTIPGSYAYKGTLLKEEVLRLENSDEIKANLPLSGAGLAAKLEGELSRGATLDLAMALVGQQRAARYEVAREELKGRCDQATHFVQSMYVGAFAMQRGERAKAAVAAEMLGAGGSGASSSDRSSLQRDGDIEACRASKPDASKPAAGCGAVLRLVLLPISPKGTKLAAPDDVAEARSGPSCPKGTVRVGGKCATVKGPVCTPETPGECKAPCDKGDADACGVYGRALRYGKGLAKSREAAAPVFNRACTLGHGASCKYLSRQYSEGKGVEANEAKAVEVAQRGCDLGDGASCFIAGRAYMKGRGVPVDEKKGFNAYEQGCNAGYASACTNLGKAYSKGRGVKPDVVYSFKLYMRACEGGSPTACYNVGVRYGKGKGTEQSDALRVVYYKRACALGKEEACSALQR